MPEPVVIMALPYRGLMVRRYLFGALLAEFITAVAAHSERLTWAVIAGAIAVWGAGGVYRMARARVEMFRHDLVVHNLLRTRLERWRAEGFVIDIARAGPLGATTSIVAKVNSGMDTPIFRIANTFGRRPGVISQRVAVLNAWVDPQVRQANPSPEEHIGGWMRIATENLSGQNGAG
ncbi:MAG: hypothetical protein ACYCTI_03525 [Acidimicrobiales bacterium]